VKDKRYDKNEDFRLSKKKKALLKTKNDKKMKKYKKYYNEEDIET